MTEVLGDSVGLRRGSGRESSACTAAAHRGDEVSGFELAECLEILVEVVAVEMGRYPSTSEDLAKIPQGHPSKLVGLSQRQAPFLVQVDRQFRSKLGERHLCRVEHIIWDL